jgi:hypothetical protein
MAMVIVGTPEGAMPMTIAVPPGPNQEKQACTTAYIVAVYQVERKEA